MTLHLKNALPVILLAAALLVSAAPAVREERPRTLVLSGRWGVSDQEPRDRAVRHQRWKIRVRLEGDGTFAGHGSLRVGAERAEGNVVGHFSGYKMKARMFTDAGVQMIQFDGTITRIGISGTFLTLAGHDAWFETTNKGFLREILE